MTRKDQKDRKKKGKFTRRKLLGKIFDVSSALILADMGYGLVPPAAQPDQPLVLPLRGSLKNLLEKESRFLMELSQNRHLQLEFLGSPIEAMLLHGVLPEEARPFIGEANRLLFYLSSNSELQEKLLEQSLMIDIPEWLVESWIGQIAAGGEINISPEFFRRVIKAYLKSEENLKNQLKILLQDEGIQQILSRRFTVNEVNRIIEAFIHALREHSQLNFPGGFPNKSISIDTYPFDTDDTEFSCVAVLLCVVAVVLVKTGVVVNAYANVNVVANANAVTNANGDEVTGSQGRFKPTQQLGVLIQLARFSDEFVRYAKQGGWVQ